MTEKKDTDIKSYFEELNSVDVSAKIEKKNGLSYLSWAWAWGELKKRDASANYTVYENKDGLNYHTDGRTAWVKVGVTTHNAGEPIEHIEYLPVMDYKNNSIPVDRLTSFDVNKAIQRALTKAIARHGLGLYIYAGEDLPEDAETATAKEATEAKPKATRAKTTKTAEAKAEPKADDSAKDPIALARAKYQELISYCKETNKDIKAVAKAFNLNAKSTAEEFSLALKKLIYNDAKAKQAEAFINGSEDAGEPIEI